jgi:hypothetical protein
MNLKTYKAVVSFGDGKPKETLVTAKNGAEASDLLLFTNPGARNVYILGAAFNSTQPTKVVECSVKRPTSSLSTFKTLKNSLNKQRLIKEVIECKRNGASYAEIAVKFNVNQGTARNWVSNANKLQKQNHV